MTGANDALIIDLLKSIDASLKELRAAMGHGSATAPARPTVAADADLDGQYGDPVIKAKDPREWTGQTMIGKRLSECPAEYLDLLAARYDYFAGRETDPKKAEYNRRDGARCRGWAARIRAGWQPDNAKFGDEAGPQW